MPRLTSQWACITILALMASTLTMAHMVKATRSRKLQMDTNGKPETTSFQASDTKGIVTGPQRSHMDNSEAVSRYWGGNNPDRGIFGSGQGSGGASLGFHNIFPFPGFPFGIIVPQVSMWGQGGGSGGVNNNPGNGGGYGGANNDPGNGGGYGGVNNNPGNGGGYGGANNDPGNGGGYGGANNNPGNGAGYGGANNNPGNGANCQCTHHNWFPMHYVLTPVYAQPTVPTSLNNMRPDGPGVVAPDPSRN